LGIHVITDLEMHFFLFFCFELRIFKQFIHQSNALIFLNMEWKTCKFCELFGAMVPLQKKREIFALFYHKKVAFFIDFTLQFSPYNGKIKT
jgi:hypothetical protein